MDELKQLVIRSLESKGVLGQLRAKLRAMVFDIIDEQESQVKSQSGFVWQNPLSKKILQTEEGMIAADLIRQFLEFYRMDYSLGVFMPECNLNKEPIRKNDLKKRSGLDDADTSMPLLMQMIKKFRAGEAHPVSGGGGGGHLRAPSPQSVSNPKSRISTSPLGQDNKLQHGGGGDTFGMNDLAESLGDDIEQSGGSDLDFFGGGGRPSSSHNSGGGGGGLTSLGNLPPLGSKKPGKLDPIKFDNLPNLDDVQEKKKKETKAKEAPKIEEPKKQMNDPLDDAESVQEIEEDIEDVFEESQEFKPNQKVYQIHFQQGLLAESAGGITASQSLGVDPSVDSLALQDYDHVEPVMKTGLKGFR